MALYINGEAFVVADGAYQRGVTSTSLEVEGSATAEFRLTEKDQTAPAGRYRARVTGDQYVIQRAAGANRLNPWAASTDLLTIDKDGITPNVPFDVSGISPFIGNVVGFLTPGQAIHTVEWMQGYGPTADPDGYCVIAVADNQLGIVPYWNYQG